MATQSVVLEHLRKMLKTVDDTTTEKQIRAKLAEELGYSVDEYKSAIKAEVSSYVEKLAESHKRKAVDEAEGAEIEPPRKAAKTHAKQATSKVVGGGGDENFQVLLSEKKRATISVFRGIARVDLREYFQKEGSWLPTKKGISLPQDQWNKLNDEAQAISAALAADDTDYQATLSDRRSITISTFREKCYLQIREYYEKDGKKQPGKTGISLNLQQWDALKSKMGDLDEALKACV
eukprot:evm.model.scf_603.1 EVM.evm.TU.scf_603.1   scf_603:3076-6937(+)